MPNGGIDGLYAVIVVGQDVSRNSGSTAGWTGNGAPGSGDALDLVKLDSAVLLVEIGHEAGQGCA